ncbi:MAG TPA: GNAT family N-acetyltransferase [Candidatus Limnocylindrales bacterium]
MTGGPSADTSPDDVRVADNPAARRFEATEGGRVVGFSTYRLTEDRVVFLHTEVEPEVEGRGIGSRLVAAALDDVRGPGLRVTPRCPFVAAFIERHPDYQDLVRD